MQMNLMIAISVLAGGITAGAVWLIWELAHTLRHRKNTGIAKEADDTGLLATAKEPEQRPK